MPTFAAATVESHMNDVTPTFGAEESKSLQPATVTSTVPPQLSSNAESIASSGPSLTSFQPRNEAGRTVESVYNASTAPPTTHEESAPSASLNAYHLQTVPETQELQSAELYEVQTVEDDKVAPLEEASTQGFGTATPTERVTPSAKVSASTSKEIPSSAGKVIITTALSRSIESKLNTLVINTGGSIVSFSTRMDYRLTPSRQQTLPLR